MEYFETYKLFNVLSLINSPPPNKMYFSDIELIFTLWFYINNLQTYPLSTFSRNMVFGIFMIIAL